MVYPFALGRPDLGDPYKSGTVEAVRIGKLLELDLFDCRRGWSTGPKAGVLFPEAEKFLIDRLRRSTARQLIQVPSNPLGWSAGKLGEWYSDKPGGDSTFDNDKGYWQQGWFEQHQRLAAALSAQKNRAAVSISGDMHASAISSISRSGDLDLSSNPIEAILPGTIGTATPGFPSSARGVLPFHPQALEIRDIAKMEERNGFSIVDVRRDRIEVKQFRWRPPEPIAAIASLEPSHTYTIERRS
jgi:phosphodiesterase/alkaline phosphatase D-like protein